VLFFTAQEHLTFSIIPAEKKDARAYAVDEDGTLLWNTAIMPPAVKDALNRGDRAAGREEVEKPHRIFGLTYHPAVDAYIAADFSGDIFAFDRYVLQNFWFRTFADLCRVFGFNPRSPSQFHVVNLNAVKLGCRLAVSPCPGHHLQAVTTTFQKR
jgi:hypothetical protein